MAQEVHDAETKRNEQREQLGSSLGRLEDRVRSEFNWRKRLTEDGPRYVVVTVTTVSIILTLVAAKKLFGRRHVDVPEEFIGVGSFGARDDALIAEIVELRNQIDHLRVKQGSGLGRSVALKLVTAVGTAAGTRLVKELLDRQLQGSPDLDDDHSREF